MKSGVDAFWPDEGDWFNLFERLTRHQLYYQGPLSTTPGVRPWSLHRNGFPGIAQWGGWVWSGDTESSWKTLEAQIAVGLNCQTGPPSATGTHLLLELTDATQRLADAERLAQQMIEEAKGRASEEGAKIIAAAKAEAEQESVKAREALREQVALLAVKGAESILKREVNASVHADLLQRLKTEL